MAGLSDIANRAQRIDDAVTRAQRGAPAAPVSPERAKLMAELTRLQKSTDPISAAPRKSRIAKIQGLLAEMDAADAATRRMAQAPPRRRARVDVSNAGKYETNESAVDQTLDSSQRYPIHRLSREPTARSLAQDHAAREEARMARVRALLGG